MRRNAGLLDCGREMFVKLEETNSMDGVEVVVVFESESDMNVAESESDVTVQSFKRTSVIPEERVIGEEVVAVEVKFDMVMLVAERFPDSICINKAPTSGKDSECEGTKRRLLNSTDPSWIEKRVPDGVLETSMENDMLDRFSITDFASPSFESSSWITINSSPSDDDRAPIFFRGYSLFPVIGGAGCVIRREDVSAA